MTGKSRVEATQQQLTLWHLTAQIQNADTALRTATTDGERARAKQQRDNAENMLLRLYTLEQSVRRQESHVAAQSLQTTLLNLALQAKPITPGLRCILDFLGPNPKALKIYLTTVCQLHEPLADATIKQYQAIISTNLLNLINSGLLSIEEFNQASAHDPNQARISTLAWSTIFMNTSLCEELTSGAVRRYRIFPQYFKQSSTKALQNYSLASISAAAKGANKFTTSRREDFTDTDERLYQKPTIPYLLDGFRATQQLHNQSSYTEEELFLLHLYDSDTDATHSFMPLFYTDLTFQKRLLIALRHYRSETNTLTSQQFRAQCAAGYEQYFACEPHASFHFAAYQRVPSTLFEPIPVKKMHLKDISTEWVTRIIDATLTQPIRLHLTVSLSQMPMQLNLHTTEKERVNNLVKNLMIQANNLAKELNRRYTEKTFYEDQTTLQKTLEKECLQCLEDALMSVRTFATTNERLQDALTTIVDTANSILFNTPTMRLIV